MRQACRGHWWVRLAINTEHIGNALRALEISESALADAWVRGGSRLDLQRRVLRIGKPPRRWRRPPWAAAAAWEPAVLHIEAAPIVSGVGAGAGIRNKCGPEPSAPTFCAPLRHAVTQWIVSLAWTQSLHAA